MIVLPEPDRTLGDVLPAFTSPLWQRQRIARARTPGGCGSFWWASWVGLCIGAWAGWLFAQALAHGACP